MTRYQIPVIGDLHLGPKPRQEQRLASLRAITNAGLELPDLAAWFYVGDVFDAASRPEDRNALAQELEHQAAAAPVVICKGNHDAEGDLEIFGRLQTTWPIHVLTVAGLLELDLRTAGMAPEEFTGLSPRHREAMAIAALPWPSEAGLLAAGVPIAGIRQAARQALEPLFLSLGAVLDNARQRGLPTVFLAHATITGAVASTGQPQVGPGIEIDGELLAHLGDCPKLLGHIHKPQVLADAGAVYVGSTCRLDYGEVEAKRWILLEAIETGGGRLGTWRYELHDQPLDVVALWTVDADLALVPSVLEGDAPVPRIVNIRISKGPDGRTEPPEAWAGQEVRLRLRYPLALRSALEEQSSYLRTMFSQAARFDLETIAEIDQALRSPAVAAAVTLEAKVRAWADASGTVLPGHLAEALDLLTHNPHQGVLDDVQASLDALLERKEPLRL